MQRPHMFASLGLVLLVGCSPATSPSTTDGSVPEIDAAAPLCGPVPHASRCGNEGSWVRGVVRFDPTHFTAGAHPALRLTLRHKFVLLAGENMIGGRLHTWANVPVPDVSTGVVPFAIDMCEFGTAMWSEENGTFNLIASLDENMNNDLDAASSNATAMAISTIDQGELSKMVDVDVSCGAPPACLDIQLDCTDGVSCTTIAPMTSCAKKTPGCTSADRFCH